MQGFQGDVKYHQGTSHDKYYPELDRHIRLTIPPNPSHLETVNPVLYGMTRSIQEHNGDLQRDKTIGILIHGDGAFAGQGVVYENLQMQDLAPYDIGGVVHIVCNNQIAFTTVPNQSRSGLYCTDLAKAVGAPILHVNADDPESVTRCLQFAYDYRKQFKKDVVIDLVGYRKYGHNELDQPAFTQPLMYQKIQQMLPVCDQYEAALLAEGVLSTAQVAAMKAEFLAKL